jgi:hypothetical protein
MKKYSFGLAAVVIAATLSSFTMKKTALEDFVYFQTDETGAYIDTQNGILGENPFSCNGGSTPCEKGFSTSSSAISGPDGNGKYTLVNTSATPDNVINKTL